MNLNEEMADETFITGVRPPKKLKYALPPDQIMLRLDKLAIKNLYKAWKEDGFTIAEFLQQLSEKLDVDDVQEGRLELLYGAINYFRDVDINGDGSMEWDEFVQDIVNQVESKSLKPQYDREANREISIKE
jgi:hypothetical protein